MKNGFRTLLVAAALATGAATLLAPEARAQACFDANIQYLGRTFVTNIAGVNYYKWEYRLTGTGCINRALSHWTLGLCQDFWPLVTGYSTESIDNSDLPDGTTTNYSNVQIGDDPTTGVAGIKWNYVSGNELNKVGEYDDFWFISPGDEVAMDVVWAGKGGQAVDYGTTTGPGCKPVPVEQSTWSGLKSRFGN